MNNSRRRPHLTSSEKSVSVRRVFAGDWAKRFTFEGKMIGAIAERLMEVLAECRQFVGVESVQ